MAILEELDFDEKFEALPLKERREIVARLQADPLSVTDTERVDEETQLQRRSRELFELDKDVFIPNA